MSAIIIPVWISFCLSVVVSVLSLLVRGSIAVVQFRRRRGDVAKIGGHVPYLQRLEAKVEDGQREIKMVAPPHRAPAHPPPHHYPRTFRPICACNHQSCSPSMSIGV